MASLAFEIEFAMVTIVINLSLVKKKRLISSSVLV